NRHLRRLLAGPDLADRLVPGAELFVAGNEKPRGTVTSATSTDDRIVGLGYVRREVEPPATVHLGSPDGPEVSVEVLS
ncbi:MAG TPA: hypothetical protein VK966_01125, partial [Longimicrobiales bacterium]|nr:hypothetical protein [Longimicrobiales bacterium]